MMKPIQNERGYLVKHLLRALFIPCFWSLYQNTAIRSSTQLLIRYFIRNSAYVIACRLDNDMDFTAAVHIIHQRAIDWSKLLKFTVIKHMIFTTGMVAYLGYTTCISFKYMYTCIDNDIASPVWIPRSWDTISRSSVRDHEIIILGS